MGNGFLLDLLGHPLHTPPFSGRVQCNIFDKKLVDSRKADSSHKDLYFNSVLCKETIETVI